MPKLARLYLDTARLGLMSPSAQLAARDFARLAGEGYSTLYWQRFFREGHRSLGPQRCAQFPGIVTWQGLEALKHSIRQLLQASPTAPVYLAGQTTTLFRSLAQVVGSYCRKVLIADTLWAPYQHILTDTMSRHRGQITPVPLRREILQHQLAPHDALQQMSRAYRQHGCDGIVLSSVSHDGIRLPIADLMAHLRAVAPVKVAVIDGAQELAHVPVNLDALGADVYLAGCHKWLGAHLPLGVCCLPRASTSSDLCARIGATQQLADGGDPLLHFLLWLQGDSSAERSETVNVLPLLCAAAALHNTLHRSQSQEERFAARLANHAIVSAIARRAGWKPLGIPRPYRTGILLLESQLPYTRRLPADALQAHLDAAGVTVTTFAGGQLRLALPQQPLSSHARRQLERALAGCNGPATATPRRPRRSIQAQ